MAEAVGLAASVIAIIDLSAKVATLCFQYSTAVGNARADVAHLQSRLNDLDACLRGFHRVLHGPNNQALPISRELIDSLDGCKSELAQVQNRLDPGKARKTMRRLGLRALKWPFDSKEVSGIVANLERYKQTIMLCLQVDQTTILLDIQQKFDSVSLQPCGDRPIAHIPCFNVPFDRDPDFVDRPDITTWLQSQYTGSASRIALVGMGGFGKSQVTIQFAHHIHSESPQTSVYWVHASSRPRFEEAYRSIAERLQLPRRNDPDVDVLGLVRDWLQTEEAGSWLMILDSADDVNLFYPIHISGAEAVTGLAHENTIAKTDQQPLAAYLPKRRNGTILITSRGMDAAERLTGSHKAVYRVSTMDEAQGLQLFQNKLGGDLDSDAATDLLRALDYIPLAITQAAAYINRRVPRVSVKRYLDTFRKSDKEKSNLLNREAGDLRRDETVSNSVVVTWQVTFEQIRHERPSAAKLLSFMSFFNPQGIPEFMLHDYDADLTDQADRDAESTDFEDDLDMLRGYSLVSVTATGDTFEMHALVQFCTRVWISAAGNEEQWRQLFLRSMSIHFPDGAFETWPTCQILLPHIEPMFEEEPPTEGLLDWACLLTNCAYYMLTIGNYGVAEDLSKMAVNARTKMLGEDHPDTLSSMANLASTYWNQGRWKEAEELDVGVLETMKTALGEEHPDTLRSMGNLASTYWNQGRWKEAEVLDVEVIETRKKTLGEKHPDTLRSMANLALTYWNQGRLQEAEELQVVVLEMREKTLGEEHPDTLTSMANLASIYWKQERWKEAEELQVGVLETRKKTLGEEHPDTLTSMANLAAAYRGQGRWKEAEELQVGVLETMKRVLGEEHPDTLMSMNNLAIIWKGNGRAGDALALMRNCIVLSQRVLGTDHPQTISSVASLAEWENTRDLLLETNNSG
ncbi:hypothetical protein FOYG_02287 [Fusarium oxysporum NRRL 32931]|uniref:DUF7779 domain-containing protein n=1 Tax=Fusarium oxysporum NRRL 32931 TaxID=660029 RepID=W9IS20_FUSOX|nr:hypothetical protein FOYG_02287 [Fusarium oxysporum NRRL 32931]